MAAPSSDTIPQPPSWPLLGNLLSLDRRSPQQSLRDLARRYGPIYRMNLLGNDFLVLSGRELVHDACDETRFDKFIGAGLRQVRNFAGDGLFTAWTHEPNWHKAHNILLPNFGVAAMRGYMPGAIVYVCGDASRMAPAVRAAFATIAAIDPNRYHEDVWAS